MNTPKFNFKKIKMLVLISLACLIGLVLHQNYTPYNGFTVVSMAPLSDIQDYQLVNSRYLSAQVFSKSCLAIGLEIDPYNSVNYSYSNHAHCSAFQWFYFPWDVNIGNPTALAYHLANLKTVSSESVSSHIKAEAAVPEFVSPQMLPAVHDENVRTVLNALTQKYRPELPPDPSTQPNPTSAFNQYITSGFDTENDCKFWNNSLPYCNGIPSLDTTAGWYYHLWFGVQYINAGASILSLTQVNLRFNNYSSSAERSRILKAYIKALKAYKLILSGQPLFFKTESVYGVPNAYAWYFDFSGVHSDLPALIDIQKWVMDIDIAGTDGMVSRADGSRVPCFGNWVAGQLCLVNNGASDRNRDGGNPNFTGFNLFGIPVSLEMDGCQACNLIGKDNGEIMPGSYPVFKNVTDERFTTCSSRIRNGLTPTMQFLSSPKTKRHNFLQYMNATAISLTNSLGVNIYFALPVQMDQNNIRQLWEDPVNYHLSGATTMGIPALDYARSKVRYCPTDDANSTGLSATGTDAMNRLYTAKSCQDDTKIASINTNDTRMQTLFHSRPEYLAVYRLYSGFLGRAPDPNGLTYWVNRFKVAQCSGNFDSIRNVAREIAIGFIYSPEYNARWAARNYSSQAYVTDLYIGYMNRTPDAGGLSYWSSEIDSGRRRHYDGGVPVSWAPYYLNNVLNEFLYSGEYWQVLNSLASAGCVQYW